jgi:hypothetical protein
MDGNTFGRAGERCPEEIVGEDPDAVETILDRIEYGVLS